METITMMHGLAMELMWRPAFSPTVIAALAGVLGVLAMVAYGRTLRDAPLRSLLLLVMRLGVVAALALLLLGPSVTPESQEEPARGELTILLDISQSMLTEDVGGRCRIDAVVQQWLGEQQLADLRKHHDVRLLGFDDSLRPLSESLLRQPADQLAAGKRTSYARTLRQVLLEAQNRNEGDHTLLLLGDGHDTADEPVQAAIDVAKSKRIAIHTVAVGYSATARDLALIALPRQEYLMAGESGQILVRVYQVGADQQTATVRLKGPDGAEQTQLIQFAGRVSATAEFTIKQEEPGNYAYHASVDAIDEEKVTTNNVQTAFVDVTARQLRVLILEGEPYWDTKFIAQSLRKDPRIALTHITQILPRGKPERIVTRESAGNIIVPDSREQFGRYDLIVLGRGIERVMTVDAMNALRQYVAEGTGQVILARGRPYDPDTPEGQAAAAVMKDLEPVVWGIGLEPIDETFVMQLTPEGQSHPAFTFPSLPAANVQVVRSLPTLLSLPIVEATKPATRVLATVGIEGQPGRPAIVTMPYGRGQVFAVLGDGLWRWRLLPPDKQELQGAFNLFWSNTMRSLSLHSDFQAGEDVSLTLSRSSLRLGDVLDVQVRLKAPPPVGFSPNLRIAMPEGTALEVPLRVAPGTPELFIGTFEPDRTGEFAATLAAAPLDPPSQTKRFTVYDLNTERLRTDARPQVLRDLAEQTGGQAYTVDQSVDLAEKLYRQKRSRLVPPQPRYVWDQAWIMLALLGWMGVEWIARRSMGWL